jgi:site-specific DNA-cytosine methylase
MDTETVPTLKQRMGTGGGQVPMVAEPIVYDGYNQKLDDSGIHRSLRIGRDSSDFVAQPIYSFDTQFGSNAAVFEDQSPTLKGSQQSPSITMPGLAVRRLTPLECERLMGWNPKVLSVKLNVCYDHQNLSVDAEILNPKSLNVAGHADQNQLIKIASSVGSPLSANQAKTFQPAVVNVRISLEEGHIRLVNEQNGQEYVVSTVEKSSRSDDTISHAHIVRLLVLMNTVLVNCHPHGKAVSQQTETVSAEAKSGVPSLTLYGNEIKQLANIVQSNIEKTPADFMSTMLLHTQNTHQDDWILKTLCCYAMNVIGGYIPNAITGEYSYLINLSISYGHTQITADGKEQADTNRYKQCGNGVATPVAKWVGEQLRLVLEM